MKCSELVNHLVGFVSIYGDADVTIPTDKTYEYIETVGDTTDDDGLTVCVVKPKRLLTLYPVRQQKKKL